MDDQGRIALHCAAMNPGGAVLLSLLKSTSATLLDLPDKQGLTPFLLSARYAASKQMRLFLKRGANTSARNVRGQTGFHLLSESPEGVDHASCLTQLREKEPMLMDSKDDSGHTPLTQAASVGNDVMLNELIRARADMNVMDGEGHMPLHWAAAGRNPQCVRLLTEYIKEAGGDLNSRLDIVYNCDVIVLVKIVSLEIIEWPHLSTTRYNWLLSRVDLMKEMRSQPVL